MVQLEFEINGKPAGTPKNASEIKLISNWAETSTEDNAEAEISTNTLQFALQDATDISNHVLGGLNGATQGIFEGLPYKINLKNLKDSTITNILDGYIDLVDDSTFISCDEVEASVKKRNNLDWFSARADSFSFAYLADPSYQGSGAITNADYVSIPYVLNFRPDETVLATTAIALFLCVQAVRDEIIQLAKATADAGEVLDVLPGTNIGDIIAGAVAFVIALAYLFAVVLAIVTMINELIEQLYPAVRSHKGIRIVNLFLKGCLHLGLEFSSTIFDVVNNTVQGNINTNKYLGLVFMPVQDEKGNKGIFNTQAKTGVPKQNSAIYNFGDFIRVMKQMFNAQIKIEGKTLRFERRDYWQKKASWTMPDVETDQSLRLSSFKYNTNEALSNFLISYQTDSQDENTLENFVGTNIQVITEPNTISDKELVNIKGFGEVRLPFARAIRKESLNDIENAIKPIRDAISGIVYLVSLGRKSIPSTSERIGVMNLSAHTTAVDKIFFVEGTKNKISSTNNLTASDLYNEFHYIDAFYNPQTQEHNQYKVYEGVEIPFCIDDWRALQTNNFFTTPDGKDGEILKVEWDINNEKAVVDYKIKELYTKNLKLVFNVGA